VLFSAGLNEKVFAEFEANKRIQPETSVIVANSQVPIRLRYSKGDAGEQTRVSDDGGGLAVPTPQVSQRSSRTPSPSGGCLVLFLFLAALLSSFLAGTLL